MERVLSNNLGFTLIEFLVAIVILMVGMLGLLQAVNLSINTNMQNQFRNEAVLVADRAMAYELSKGFDAVSTGTKKITDVRKVVNALQSYSVSRSGTSFQNSKRVNFQISWKYRNTRYTHDVEGVVSKSQQ